MFITGSWRLLDLQLVADKDPKQVHCLFSTANFKVVIVGGTNRHFFPTLPELNAY